MKRIESLVKFTRPRTGSILKDGGRRAKADVGLRALVKPKYLFRWELFIAIIQDNDIGKVTAIAPRFASRPTRKQARQMKKFAKQMHDRKFSHNDLTQS